MTSFVMAASTVGAICFDALPLPQPHDDTAVCFLLGAWVLSSYVAMLDALEANKKALYGNKPKS